MAARHFVFDAYGTLFDVHAAIDRHRAAAGPDADRLSDLWRTKQLEFSWTLTLAGRYEPFWSLTERALDYALARLPLPEEYDDFAPDRVVADLDALSTTFG